MNYDLEWDWIQPRLSRLNRWAELPKNLLEAAESGLKELVWKALNKTKKTSFVCPMMDVKEGKRNLLVYANGYILDTEIVLTMGFGTQKKSPYLTLEPESHFFISWEKKNSDPQFKNVDIAVEKLFDLVAEDVHAVLKNGERNWDLSWKAIPETQFFYRWTQDNRLLFMEANKLLADSTPRSSSSNYLRGNWGEIEEEIVH